MSRDLLLGSTKKNWDRSSGSSDCGSLPAGATGYAPTKWWTPAQAEDKVQELMRSGGLLGTSLSREDAEKKAMAFLRKNLIGVIS